MNKEMLHNLGRIPDGLSYDGDIVSLDEDDEVKKLTEWGIEEAWYWYSYQYYEGMGQILLRRGDKFDIHDMGHCSCYGPLEHYTGFTERFSCLDDIEKSCTDGAYREIAPLVEMAKNGT